MMENNNHKNKSAMPNNQNQASSKSKFTEQIYIIFRKRSINIVLGALVFFILAIFTQWAAKETTLDVIATVWVSLSSIYLGWAFQVWYQDIKNGDKNLLKKKEILNETENYLRVQAKRWHDTLNALSLKNPSKELLNIIEYFWRDHQSMVRTFIEEKAQAMDALGANSSDFINEMDTKYRELRKLSTKLGRSLFKGDASISKKYNEMIKLLEESDSQNALEIN